MQDYDKLREDARKASLVSGYGAVFEVVTYRTGKSVLTVFGGTQPMKSLARNGVFRGLVCQFHNGQPYGDGKTVKSISTPQYTNSSELPF